jgi:hypothetical protein
VALSAFGAKATFDWNQRCGTIPAGQDMNRNANVVSSIEIWAILPAERLYTFQILNMDENNSILNAHRNVKPQSGLRDSNRKKSEGGTW